MNPHQPVMKPGRDFVRRIGAVLDPVAAVIQQVAQIDADTMGRNPDIALGQTEFSGPAPDPAKHPLVQAFQKLLVEYIALAREGPFRGFQNVGLFGFVEFVAQRDVRRDQTVPFFRRQRCGGTLGQNMGAAPCLPWGGPQKDAIWLRGERYSSQPCKVARNRSSCTGMQSAASTRKRELTLSSTSWWAAS